MPDWLQETLQPWIEGTSGKNQTWQDALWNMMMPGGGSTSAATSGSGSQNPETYQGGGVRGGDQGRVSPDMPWYNMDPYGLWNQWDTPSFTPSDQGILGDNAQTIVGPSPWEQYAGMLSTKLTEGERGYGKAGNLLDSLTKMNGLEKRANYLAEVYADPKNKPYESKKAIDWLSEARGRATNPVDFSGYEGDPLFQQQMAAWDQNIDPTITNSAISMGLGRSGAAAAAKGLSKTNAVRDALQEYIGQKNINKDRAVSTLLGGASQFGQLGRDADARRTQNLQTKLGLGGALRGSTENAAQGWMGLGDRSHQSKLDAISNLMDVGGTMRGIRQEQSDSAYNDWLRKVAAFEGALGGPAGMTPGMLGAQTTQQKKNK